MARVTTLGLLTVASSVGYVLSKDASALPLALDGELFQADLLETRTIGILDRALSSAADGSWRPLGRAVAATLSGDSADLATLRSVQGTLLAALIAVWTLLAYRLARRAPQPAEHDLDAREEDDSEYAAAPPEASPRWFAATVAALLGIALTAACIRVGAASWTPAFHEVLGSLCAFAAMWLLLGGGAEEPSRARRIGIGALAAGAILIEPTYGWIGIGLMWMARHADRRMPRPLTVGLSVLGAVAVLRSYAAIPRAESTPDALQSWIAVLATPVRALDPSAGTQPWPSSVGMEGAALWTAVGIAALLALRAIVDVTRGRATGHALLAVGALGTLSWMLWPAGGLAPPRGVGILGIAAVAIAGWTAGRGTGAGRWILLPAAGIAAVTTLGTIGTGERWSAPDALLADVAEVEPGHAQVLAHRGTRARRRGEHGVAANALERAVRSDPGHATAWTELGRAHLDRGDPATARAAFEQATLARPDLAAPHRELGLLQVTTDAPEVALASLRRATELAPGSATAWQALADTLRGLGRTEAADEAEARHAALVGDGEHHSRTDDP